MTAETMTFEAEVSKLLHIVTHSLYSNREIFLRELISNASDACDRLRHAAITDPKLVEDGGSDFAITLRPDAKAGTLTVADNGEGMDRAALVENLGTIARSGTSAFLSALEDGKKGDVSQIGQFGVGFYSAFMVADQVEVFSRRAGEAQGWKWTSDGQGSYTVEEAADVPRGTRIVLHMKDDAKDFLEAARLRHIVKTYSDHIAMPVMLDDPAAEKKDDEDADTGPERLNEASALWTRPRSEVTEDQYTEFYRHVGHAYDDPWHTLHYRAEGAIEYTGLLFVPSSKPFDLFTPERRASVRLYVNRVFIADDVSELLPPWLRFVKGVVDSPDLPLNVSREMLQDQPILRKIRKGLVKRLLSDLEGRAKTDAEGYTAFWANFGAVLKEGLYEDPEHRDTLLKLARFTTTTTEDGKPTALEEYVARMKGDQKAIYFLTGDSLAKLKSSPHLEGFKAKGVEVLLLTDPVDEFWVNAVGKFGDHDIKSVTAADADLDALPDADGKADEDAADAPKQEEVEKLTARLKEALGEDVADVKVSTRLTDSPVCLSGDGAGMSLHLERMLRQSGQGADLPSMPRVLEINPKHALIRRLEALDDTTLSQYAHLLLDQARLVEGEPLPDPAGFARRLTELMTRG